MPEPLLQLKEITKSFPGVLANDKITFDLMPGEIHALVGENGAGKSTLMKIVYGLYKADSGRIFVHGKPVTLKTPKEAIRNGIGMVHQHFMLVPCFSVLENIIIGEETSRFGILLNKKPAEKIKKIMEDNRLIADLPVEVGTLPVGIQQRIEIIKVLYRGAEILIFDEPTAVLTPQETVELFKTLQVLKNRGKGIIFISHKLDEVLEIADRITVLRRGKTIHTMAGNVATKSGIAELMVGKPVLLHVDIPPFQPGKTVLEVQKGSLSHSHGLKILDNIQFKIHAGEIYGIAGVEGNGQTELIDVITGSKKLHQGSILLEGQNINQTLVRERRELGISHIPEDRQKFGIYLSFSIEENSVIGRHHLKPFVKNGFIRNFQEIKEFAKGLIKKFDIRTPSETLPMNALSGGNQQKLIIARELSASPRLIVAAQPTRGVDVGAIEFIHKQLVQARTEGKAILLVSADLDEVLSLSDRIGVMYKGRIIQEFTRADAVKEKVGFYMMGEKNELAE